VCRVRPSPLSRALGRPGYSSQVAHTTGQPVHASMQPEAQRQQQQQEEEEEEEEEEVAGVARLETAQFSALGRTVSWLVVLTDAHASNNCWRCALLADACAKATGKNCIACSRCALMLL